MLKTNKFKHSFLNSRSVKYYNVSKGEYQEHQPDNPVPKVQSQYNGIFKDKVCSKRDLTKLGLLLIDNIKSVNRVVNDNSINFDSWNALLAHDILRFFINKLEMKYRIKSCHWISDADEGEFPSEALAIYFYDNVQCIDHDAVKGPLSFNVSKLRKIVVHSQWKCDISDAEITEYDPYTNKQFLTTTILDANALSNEFLNPNCFEGFIRDIDPLVFIAIFDLRLSYDEYFI